MKIISYKENNIIDTCNDINIELPSYVLSYDDNHPFLNIDEDDYSILAYNQGTEVERKYLLSKLKFFVQYDYRLFTQSELHKEQSHLQTENLYKEDASAAYYSLSLLLSKKLKTALIDNNRTIDSLVEEINNLTETNILEALIYYTDHSITKRSSRLSGDEYFAVSFSNLIKRVYYAIKHLERCHGISLELAAISDMLYPFVSHNPVKTSVFANYSTFKKLVELLFLYEAEEKQRSGIYRLVSILESLHHSVHNTSAFLISECADLPDLEFRMGYVGHKRIAIKMSETEYVAISRTPDSVQDLIDCISRILKNLYEDYLSESNNNKKTSELLKEKLEYEYRQDNIQNGDDLCPWNSYLIKMVRNLKNQVDTSRDKITPQSSYDSLLCDMYFKLKNTNTPYWKFDKHLIEDLLYKLYQHPHDDQSHLFDMMYMLNYTKDNAYKNTELSLTSINNLRSETEIDWSKMNYTSESPEEAIKRVMLFIQPMLKEKRPGIKGGFIKLASKIVLQRNPYAIESIEEFKDKFRKVLCSETIRWELMRNHPIGKQKGGGFRCGFNAMLLCNILGLLMDRNGPMKYRPIDDNGSGLANLLFVDRGVGTGSYKNYIYKYNEYITDENNRTSYSVLTQDMLDAILSIF